MSKPNLILVVVERARDASKLIEKALVIARQFGARIELFLCESEQAYELAHAYDREGIQHACAESIGQARDYLTDLRACANAPDVDIAIDAQCESPLYEAVVRKVLRSRPALVIKGVAPAHCGQHGRADPNDWQLMRTCPTTLMLAGRKMWHAPPRFAAAVDVSEHERETPSLPQHVLQAARTLALSWQAPVEVMYGEADGSEGAAAAHAATLRSLCESSGVTPDRTHVLHGAAEESLATFAREQDYDVLVLGALTHRAADTALVGTLTSKLLEALDCDFVLVKPSSYRCPIWDRFEVAEHAAPPRVSAAASY